MSTIGRMQTCLLTTQCGHSNYQVLGTKILFNFVLALSLILVSSGDALSGAPFLTCVVDENIDNPKVSINIQTPHPKEMLLRRPDGSFVDLQGDFVPFKFPVDKGFENLGAFVIDTSSTGTEFEDGVEKSAPLLRGAGTYYLLVAENTETELENTLYFDCEFDIHELRP